MDTIVTILVSRHRKVLRELQVGTGGGSVQVLFLALEAQAVT